MNWCTCCKVLTSSLTADGKWRRRGVCCPASKLGGRWRREWSSSPEGRSMETTRVVGQAKEGGEGPGARELKKDLFSPHLWGQWRGQEGWGGGGVGVGVRGLGIGWAGSRNPCKRMVTGAHNQVFCNAHLWRNPCCPSTGWTQVTSETGGIGEGWTPVWGNAEKGKMTICWHKIHLLIQIVIYLLNCETGSVNDLQP